MFGVDYFAITNIKCHVWLLVVKICGIGNFRILKLIGCENEGSYLLLLVFLLDMFHQLGIILLRY